MQLKVGARYVSRACNTEVIVVRAPSGDVALTCAGKPMLDSTESKQVTGKEEPDADQLGGTLLGKRYTDPDGSLELLVVKPGAGSLAVGTTPLEPKKAKTLPSSD